MQVTVKHNDDEEQKDVFDTDLVLMAILRPDGLYTTGIRHEAGMNVEHLMDAMESIMTLVLHYVEKCYRVGADKDALPDAVKERIQKQVLELFERRVQSAKKEFQGDIKTVDLMSLAATMVQ